MIGANALQVRDGHGHASHGSAGSLNEATIEGGGREGKEDELDLSVCTIWMLRTEDRRGITASMSRRDITEVAVAL